MLNREKTIYSIKNNKFVEYSGIIIQELPYTKKINLRIDPNNNDYKSYCGKILNAILPSKPNTYSENQRLKIIWLGPDEWLITDYIQNDDLHEKLRQAVGDKESSVTDVSENRTIIRISGEKLFNLLAKFLVLDLEKTFKNESSAAQTLFVKVPILIVRVFKNYSEKPQFDIFVNRSQANYIYNLLVDGTKNLDF